MNLKKILIIILACTIVLLNSCNSDESSAAKNHFTFDEETISLDGANLFLVNQNSWMMETHEYREYIITDGTLDNYPEVEWTFSDLEDATYFIVVQLADPEVVEPAEFPMDYNFFDVGEGLRVSYVYAAAGNSDSYVGYNTRSDDDDHNPVIITGGTDSEEEMTFRYSGSLTFRYLNGEVWMYQTITGKFNFTGIVINMLG